MPGMRSSAATKCISDVPGLEKQVLTPLFSSECTRLSAPFMFLISGLVPERGYRVRRRLARGLG